MSFDVQLSRRFLRESKSFFRRRRDLEAVFQRIVMDLRHDPFQPHLHWHALKGELEGFHAISLTHSFRIVLILLITEREITLINIRTHDEVYR